MYNILGIYVDLNFIHIDKKIFHIVIIYSTIDSIKSNING